MRRQPLAGRRIVITRRAEQAGSLHRALKSRGAEVVELPTIELAPPRSWRPVDAAIERLPEYDWVVFTSVNGVESFAARLRKKGRTMSALKGALIAAIGPATARALRARGLRVRVVPEEFRAEGLVQALQRVRWSGKKVLLARAAKARQVVPQELRRRGARVDVIAVYRTVVPAASRTRIKNVFRGRKPDAITFTSSSTVRNFCSMVGRSQGRRILQDVAVITIGPVTSRTARALGLKVALEAKRYTVAGLTEALEKHFAQPQTTTSSGSESSGR